LVFNEKYIDCYIVGHSSDYGKEILQNFKNANADSFERKPTKIDRMRILVKKV